MVFFMNFISLNYLFFSVPHPAVRSSFLGFSKRAGETHLRHRYLLDATLGVGAGQRWTLSNVRATDWSGKGRAEKRSARRTETKEETEGKIILIWFVRKHWPEKESFSGNILLIWASIFDQKRFSWEIILIWVSIFDQERFSARGT